jgi:hypothetical protein
MKIGLANLLLINLLVSMLVPMTRFLMEKVTLSFEVLVILFLNSLYLYYSFTINICLISSYIFAYFLGLVLCGFCNFSFVIFEILFL